MTLAWKIITPVLKLSLASLLWPRSLPTYCDGDALKCEKYRNGTRYFSRARRKERCEWRERKGEKGEGGGGNVRNTECFSSRGEIC